MAFTSRISIQRRDHTLLTNDYDIEAWKAASQHSTLDTSTSSVPRITKVSIHTEKTVHGESESGKATVSFLAALSDRCIA
jgi:hypothetical protein